MSKSADEQRGLRKLVQRGGQNFYFYISDTDIMFSAPGEGDIKNQDAYSSVNAICRLASKARAAGVPWSTIVKQLDGANVTGNRTWVQDIAQAVRDTVGE